MSRKGGEVIGDLQRQAKALRPLYLEPVVPLYTGGHVKYMSRILNITVARAVIKHICGRKWESSIEQIATERIVLSYLFLT